MGSERETVNTAIQLLQRVELKGSEVPAFIGVMQWLNRCQEQLNAAPPPPPPQPDASA